MGMISKAKAAVRAYRGIENKKEIVGTVIRTVRRGGISELKKAVMRASDRGNGVAAIDLYERQQNEIREYEETGIKVLFIILVEQANAYISNTIESIERLMHIEKETIVLAIEGYEGEHKLPIHFYADVWSERLEAIFRSSQADYVYLIRGGNYLAPDMGGALFEGASRDRYHIIYSDECIQMENSKKYLLKPDFSRFDLLYNHNMGQAAAFLREALLEAGGIGTDYKRLDDLIYGLFLKLSSDVKAIKHIDRVLLIHKYEYRETVEWIRARNVNRELMKKEVLATAVINYDRLRIDAGKINDVISIIVPVESYVEAVTCIDSILTHTRYVSYDIVAVAEKEVDLALKERYINTPKIYCMEAEGNSYSAKCNTGARQANGDILLFLSDDIEVKQSDWLYNIASIFAFPWVGGVSPKVIRKENTIRYAGMIAGGFGFTPIPFNGELNEQRVNENEPAFFSHEISVLSGTCLAIRKNAFHQVKGFNTQETPDKFSNAVLSFELMRNNWSCIYCAETTVTAGNKTWYDSWYDKEDTRAYLYLLKNFGEWLTYDPYFTEEMKQQYLRGVPTGFRIYKKKIENEKKGSILLVSHDALLGGATIVLHGAAKALKKDGYFVTFLVPEEGEILKELERDGIHYIVDSTFYSNVEWMKYANNYDVIFLNTLIMGEKISELQKYKKKIVWWIHEAPEYYTRLKRKFTVEDDGKLVICCVGKYAQAVFKKYFPHLHTEILLYGLQDYQVTDTVKMQNKYEKINFLSVGTIEKRKGQDVLCEAIEKLPKKEREKCKFIFVGKKIQEEVYNEIEKILEKYPEQVELLPPVGREKIMELYHKAFSVVCSSREDPMPVFMTECMMMSRVPICSEHTGTAKVLREGYDGFIYGNNSSEELAQKILYVITHQDEMELIGKNARKTYEQIFRVDKFEENIISKVGMLFGEAEME